MAEFQTIDAVEYLGFSPTPSLICSKSPFISLVHVLVNLYKDLDFLGDQLAGRVKVLCKLLLEIFLFHSEKISSGWVTCKIEQQAKDCNTIVDMMHSRGIIRKFILRPIIWRRLDKQNNEFARLVDTLCSTFGIQKNALNTKIGKGALDEDPKDEDPKDKDSIDGETKNEEPNEQDWEFRSCIWNWLREIMTSPDTSQAPIINLYKKFFCKKKDIVDELNSLKSEGLSEIDVLFSMALDQQLQNPIVENWDEESEETVEGIKITLRNMGIYEISSDLIQYITRNHLSAETDDLFHHFCPIIGETISVKRDYCKDDHELLNFLCSVKSMQNRRGVKPIGYCIEGRYHVITEYTPQDRMDQKIVSQRKFFEVQNSVLSARDRIYIAYNIAKQLEQLHNEGKFHCSISSANIGLRNFESILYLPTGIEDQPRMESSFICLEDDSGNKREERSCVYIDPELRSDPDLDYNASYDVYSFGIFLMELYTGSLLVHSSVDRIVEELKCCDFVSADKMIAWDWTTLFHLSETILGCLKQSNRSEMKLVVEQLEEMLSKIDKGETDHHLELFRQFISDYVRVTPSLPPNTASILVNKLSDRLTTPKEMRRLVDQSDLLFEREHKDLRENCQKLILDFVEKIMLQEIIRSMAHDQKTVHEACMRGLKVLEHCIQDDDFSALDEQIETCNTLFQNLNDSKDLTGIEITRLQEKLGNYHVNKHEHDFRNLQSVEAHNFAERIKCLSNTLEVLVTKDLINKLLTFIHPGVRRTRQEWIIGVPGKVAYDQNSVIDSIFELLKTHECSETVLNNFSDLVRDGTSFDCKSVEDGSNQDYRKLERENKRLRAEIEKLHAEIGKLRAENRSIEAHDFSDGAFPLSSTPTLQLPVESPEAACLETELLSKMRDIVGNRTLNELSYDELADAIRRVAEDCDFIEMADKIANWIEDTGEQVDAFYSCKSVEDFMGKLEIEDSVQDAEKIWKLLETGMVDTEDSLFTFLDSKNIESDKPKINVKKKLDRLLTGTTCNWLYEAAEEMCIYAEGTEIQLFIPCVNGFSAPYMDIPRTDQLVFDAVGGLKRNLLISLRETKACPTPEFWVRVLN